jgi:hypothetical protein
VRDSTPEPSRRLRDRLLPWLATGDVHEWTKTVAVVVASLWGVYTFIWRDILVPSWAPASLVIELKPRQEGSDALQAKGGKGNTRLKLRVIATNTSTRTLYLLPNVWWASEMQRSETGPGQSFESAANAILRDSSVLQAERGQEFISTGVLATGRLFIDDQILPGETLGRDLSIALPKSGTLMVLQWLVPVLTRKPLDASGESLLFSGQRMGWAYSEKAEALYPVLCRDPKPAATDTLCEQVSIQQEIRRFDPRSMIFSRTVILND